MRLGKQELLDRVMGEAIAAGWSVAPISDDHPFDVILGRGDETLRVRVYVWNLTHGGATRSADEYRIQITGVAVPLEGQTDFKTLILGWHDDLEVIAAFDPVRHRDQVSASPSIQVSLTVLQEASSAGALRVHERGNDEIAVAFPPDLLVGYIKEQEDIHGFGEAPEHLGALEAAGAGETAPDEYEMPLERRVVVQTLRRYHREATFRKRVTDAYEGRCAMCGLQLDLIQAAHVVPVGDPDSTDNTGNGIALCPLHHLAYDRGLVGVDEVRKIIIDEDFMAKLRDAGLGGGEEAFRAALLDRIHEPTEAGDRPTPENLRRGLEVRGW